MIGGVETHVLFDTGATHSFVSPGLVGKGLFCLDAGDNFGIVRAAGGQGQGKSRKFRSAIWSNRIGREAYSAVGSRPKA